MAGQRRNQLIRAFIAFDPGETGLSTARSVIGRLQAGPQGDAIRWVSPGNLHVTLRFLGNIREDMLEPLHRAVGSAVATVPAFDLHIGALAMFPHRRPRVVAAALEPEQPVVRLAEAVSRGLEATGLELEDRPLRPHLTLGRVKRGAPSPLSALAKGMERLNESRDQWPGPDRVSEIAMIRSDLKPNGPVYTVLWSASLAGA